MVCCDENLDNHTEDLLKKFLYNSKSENINYRYKWFIGRNLKEYLETEPSLYELYTPKRQELNLYTNEVENYVNLHKFDVVIHSSVTLTLDRRKSQNVF